MISCSVVAARPPARPARRAAGALLVLALAAGCDTIDPGPPTGPPPGCNAAPYFFVEQVWPNYLRPDAPYGTSKGCGQDSCHDAQSGRGYFRLQAVAYPPPDPSFARQPISTWPAEWRDNLESATRLLNCADPT